MNDRPMTSMGQRSVEGFLWSGSAVVVQAVAQILVIGLLARLLTAFEFGVVSAALVVVALIRIFTESLIGPALTQRPDLTERHERAAFALSMYFGVVSSVVLWASAGLVAGVFNIPELVPVVQVLSIMFFLEAPGAVPGALLQRDLAFPRLSIVETVSFIVGYAAVGVILALMGAGVWALVAAQLSYSLVRSVILLFSRPHAFGLVPFRRESREILTFGGGHASARFFNYLAVEGDYFVVGRWISAEALGFYGRAYQLAMRPSVLLGKALDRVIFPVMAAVQTDYERLRRVYRRSVSLVVTLTTPLSALGVVLGPEVVRVVLGPDWEPVNIPFQIFSAGLLFRSVYKPADSLAKAIGIVYERARRQAIYAILVFGFALVGTRWGLPGVAFGVFLAVVANSLMMAQLSLAALGLRWRDYFSAHYRGLLLALAAVAVAWPTSVLIRVGGGGDLQVLIGSLGVCAVVAVVAILISPETTLGADVLWFRSRARRRAKGPEGVPQETQGSERQS